MLTLAAVNDVEWSDSSTTCCLMFRNDSRALRLEEVVRVSQTSSKSEKMRSSYAASRELENTRRF